MEHTESAEILEEVTEEIDAEEAKKGKDPKALASEILEIVNTMLVSVFVVLLVFTYLIRPVTVQGGSMNSTLFENDKLLMYRFMYEPTPGDIVVIDNDEGHILNAENEVVNSGSSLTKNIIKRVIAVGGQTLDIDVNSNVIYVDGVALEEDYINEQELESAGIFSYPITIPEGYIFVMGDNRNHSTDSRSSSVGLVEVEDVLGKTFFRYAPFNEIGFVG